MGRPEDARARNPSGKPPFLLLCDREILYHGFLCFASIVVIVTQATVLNFYIIAFFRGYYHHVATYFWFLGDLFIVCLFAISFTTAYRYIHLRRKLELTGRYTEYQIQQKIQRSIYKHVMFLSPRHCGTLPFSFISWCVYSSYLVGKLTLILTSDIPAHMIGDMASNDTTLTTGFTFDSSDPVRGLNSNLLKVAVGLSALVFIIMLQAHHNHDPDSPHSGYIAGVCHYTAVEVFDSVTLLSLLIVQDKDSSYLEIWNFNQVIIVLSAINLVLPSLTLYSLSLSDFGRHLDRVIHIKVASQLLQLLVINIPYLGVRIYLWTQLKYELSLFVVKNCCYIFMLVHSLYPGMVYVLTGKPCGHLVRRGDDDQIDGGGTGNGNVTPAIRVDYLAAPNRSRRKRNSASNGSRNSSIEMVPMRSPNEERRNLNRVSVPTSDEIEPVS